VDRRILDLRTGPLETAGIVLIIAAKFGLPLLIVPFPFAAGWANFFLDSVDGDLLIPLGLPNETYQPVDKITDWVTYVAIVVVGFRNAWPTKRLMLGLFLFRSIGQAGFLSPRCGSVWRGVPSRAAARNRTAWDFPHARVKIAWRPRTESACGREKSRDNGTSGRA
jgi:hypothetical protein